MNEVQLRGQSVEAMVETETPHLGSSSNAMQQKLHEGSLVAMCDAVVEDDSSENACAESGATFLVEDDAFDIEQLLWEVEFETSNVEALLHVSAHQKTKELQEAPMSIEHMLFLVEKIS